MFYFVFFFFSSRRRHTCSLRDWSSDVCSSDLLELDVPHVETASVDGASVVSASWQTTGEVLEPPLPPGPVRRALLGLRPWRLAPPPRPEAERPLWQLVAVLYTSLALIVTLVIGLAFLVARLVTGNAV